MPRTFRLSLLRIEVRLREVMHQMRQVAAAVAMQETTCGAKETYKAAVVEPTEMAPTEMAKMMTEAVKMEAAGPTQPKPVTAQHAPKLPKGICPSACHTIGGTGAEKRARTDDGRTMEIMLILCVLKHLVFHVHVDEHPVGTGEAAPDAETCTEGRRQHYTT